MEADAEIFNKHAKVKQNTENIIGHVIMTDTGNKQL